MTSEDAEGHAGDPAVAMMADLIAGVKNAFDQNPDAPQSAENMLYRFAEALPPIATFLSGLPRLGPKYGNHFNELASALKDWREGKHHALFDVETKFTAASSSQQGRAKANVVLAVEALKMAGRGFRDEQLKIKTFEGAAEEVLREFKTLKKLISKKTIEQWRTEFSRRKRQCDEATELLEVTRAYMLTIAEITRLAGEGRSDDAIAMQLGCAQYLVRVALAPNALLRLARRCGDAALGDFEWIKMPDDPL
jgi:hypothetical protein